MVKWWGWVGENFVVNFRLRITGTFVRSPRTRFAAIRHGEAYVTELHWNRWLDKRRKFESSPLWFLDMYQIDTTLDSRQSRSSHTCFIPNRMFVILLGHRLSRFQKESNRFSFTNRTSTDFGFSCCGCLLLNWSKRAQMRKGTIDVNGQHHRSLLACWPDHWSWILVYPHRHLLHWTVLIWLSRTWQSTPVEEPCEERSWCWPWSGS